MRRLGIAIVILLVLIAALALAGCAYQTISEASDARAFRPPGELVDVGGYKMHIYCSGEGSPTVILDALFPGTVSNWVWVQPELARVTRVCSYDRAGLGWSDSGPDPRDANQAANELAILLRNSNIPGPYVIVGHSLGGLSTRMFADLYPDQVAGMVLVEGTNPDSWQRLGKPEGVGVPRAQLAVAPLMARLGIFRLHLIPSYSTDPDLPPQQRAELQAFFDSTKSFETIRAVDASFSAALDQVRHAGGLGSKPLMIVLGSKGDGLNDALRDLFKQQAALSSNSATRIVEGATHPGLVDNRESAMQTTSAILEVIQAVRNGQRLKP